jgi:hypothetical protein
VNGETDLNRKDPKRAGQALRRVMEDTLDAIGELEQNLG